MTVFQAREYGVAVSSRPRLVPSSWNWTPATPTLSDAVAATVMVPDTELFAVGAVMETAGGGVSGGGSVREGKSADTAGFAAGSLDRARGGEIGRGVGRGRGEISGVGGSFKKKKQKSSEKDRKTDYTSKMPIRKRALLHNAVLILRLDKQWS